MVVIFFSNHRNVFILHFSSELTFSVSQAPTKGSLSLPSASCARPCSRTGLPWVYSLLSGTHLLQSGCPPQGAGGSLHLLVLHVGQGHSCTMPAPWDAGESQLQCLKQLLPLLPLLLHWARCLQSFPLTGSHPALLCLKFHVCNFFFLSMLTQRCYHHF